MGDYCRRTSSFSFPTIYLSYWTRDLKHLFWYYIVFLKNTFFRATASKRNKLQGLKYVFNVGYNVVHKITKLVCNILSLIYNIYIYVFFLIEKETEEWKRILCDIIFNITISYAKLIQMISIICHLFLLFSRYFGKLDCSAISFSIKNKKVGTQRFLNQWVWIYLTHVLVITQKISAVKRICFNILTHWCMKWSRQFILQNLLFISDHQLETEKMRKETRKNKIVVIFPSELNLKRKETWIVIHWNSIYSINQLPTL